MTDYIKVGKSVPEEEPYADMVTRLFKTEGFHNKHDALMHAAIGICGEVGELIEAVEAISPDPYYDTAIMEELGDIHFYICAITEHVITSNEYKVGGLVSYFVEFSPGNNRSLLLRLSVESSGILDNIKKGWVYGKDIDFLKVLVELDTIIYLLNTLADRLSMTLAEILEANRIKLTGKGGRYENGYTDQAAQGRADKVGE